MKKNKLKKNISLQELTERSLPPHQSPLPAGSSVKETKKEVRHRYFPHILNVYCLPPREWDAVMERCRQKALLLIDDFHRNRLQE